MPYLKPPSCSGCPFYTASKYFVPDRIIENSSVAIVAQNPGENEEAGSRITGYEWSGGKRYDITQSVKPQPLIGPSGYSLRENYWPLTQLSAPLDDVSLMNVIKCRPYGKNELPALERVITRQAIAHCTATHFKLPPAVKHILALGQISLWFTTRQKSVKDWRGYILPYVHEVYDGSLKMSDTSNYYNPLSSDISVMPTFHIAALYKGSFDASSEGVDRGGNKQYQHAVLMDFRKFGRWVKGSWPASLPQIQHNIIPKEWPSFAAFDTEYTPDDELIRWSLSADNGKTYVVEAEASPKSISMIPGAVVVGQNLLADIHHLARIIDSQDLKGVEDTMLAHSVLWTGEPHSLDYILSIYGSLNRHKHLSDSEDIEMAVLYSGLDAYTTLHDAWFGMMKEFEKDQRSWNVYKKYRLPLINIIAKAQRRGIAVDRERLSLVREIYTKKMEEWQGCAKELTGEENFNLGSQKQVAGAVYKG